MEDRVDVTKFELVSEIAFKKSAYLSSNYSYYSVAGFKEEVSCFYLRKIIKGKEEEIIERINLVYFEAVKNSRSTGIVINNMQLSVADLIWARLCVLAYYYYKDDPLWTGFIFEKLEEKIEGNILKQELLIAKKAIDKLFDDKQKLANARRSIPQKQTPTNNVMQGQETDDDMPGLYNVAIKINKGEITNLGEVNWAKEIVQMADLCKLMPYHYPFILWLWGILGLIEDPTKRMDVLGKMQDVAPNCFKTQDEVQEFVRDCDSLVKINTRIREYYLRNDTVKYTLWKGERSCMNGLVGIFSRNFVRPEEMVAIAEEFFCSARDRKKEKLLILLLRADQHIGKLSIDNINDFARSLYVAEGFRQLILSGEEDFYEFPTLDSFDRKLRNACFEVYISMRLQQIRHEFDEDNTLVDDPEDLECLEHLYEEESMVANREITFEDFRGSAAYAAMWYPGRSMVLDIIKVFIEYLGKKITKLKSGTSIQGAASVVNNYTVQGDVVQGTKNVNAEINNIEAGGIGVQTTKQ